MIRYQSLYSLGINKGENVVGDVNRFKRVSRDGFNATDSVDTRFFKLLFYFYNDPGADTMCDWFDGGSSGLLAPTWLDHPNLENGGDYYKYNSAWAFLKNNYEEERADALKTFVNLLSNISTESPWYFQKITGVDEALGRDKWKVSEERKKISIECLSDPVDHRIESLLSLYRSIVWSHARKCEILPANLRKFDMGLFVFSGLIGRLHTGRLAAAGNETGYAQIGSSNSANAITNLTRDRASYKYIEFHNCEISIDSIKSGFSDLSNDVGNKQTFTIDIYFDDCYENEYNPFLLKTFGDMFIWDMWTSSRAGDGTVNGNIPEDRINDVISTTTSSYTNAEAAMREMIGEPTPKKDDPLSILKDKAEQMANGVVSSIKDSINNAIYGGLGNIYGQGMGMKGATDAVDSEINKQMKSLSSKITGNINNAVTGISRNLTSAATAPVLGTIKATGTVMNDLEDAKYNLIAKPILGTTKMIENTSKRITDLGYSYVNEAGQYVVNESDKLGTIAYTAQANLPNAIGKERLNPSSLGSVVNEEGTTNNENIIPTPKPQNLGSITKDDQADIEQSEETGYVDEKGNYIYVESNDLGSIAGNKTNQQVSPNLIGKNRLQAKLGKLS